MDRALPEAPEAHRTAKLGKRVAAVPSDVAQLADLVGGISPHGHCLVVSFVSTHDHPSRIQTLLSTGVFADQNDFERLSVLVQRSHRTLEAGGVNVFEDKERDGFIACVRIALDKQNSYAVAVFQPASVGEFTPAQISSFRSVSQLVSGKITAFDAAASARVESLEEELSDLRSFYRHFSNSIKQCFWVLDLSTQRVLTVSENFESVWGASRSILTNGGLTGFMSSVSPDDKDRVLAEFHGKLGQELDTELRVIDQAGETRWLWLRGGPLTDEGGANRMLLIADDVSEKKFEEEHVRQREVDLINRARALAVVDLASGVAHEINNPLTIIVGKAAEMKSKAKAGTLDAEATMAYAEKIQATSLRISDIVRSLKTLARQERADVFSSIPVSFVMNEVRDMCSERLRAAGIELQMPDEGIEESITLEMNATLVSQLILNLINNSFDAVQALETKWVRVEVADITDSVFFFVTDSGAGIPIKIRGRIFDPFFTTKGPDKGTGLGLSLSTSIAAHHHGTLRLDTMNSHTRFVLQLPKKHPKRSI